MRSKFANAVLLFGTSNVLASKQWYSGWNLPSNNPDTTCKTSSDWAIDFSVINSEFRSQYTYGTPAVKIFNTNQCNTTKNMVQPAIDAKIPVLATVVANEANENRYELDKTALEDAIKLHGCDWLIGVSVGSEDLYREEITSDRLVEQMNEVRSLIRNYQGNCQTIPIMHADVPQAWRRYKNVIDASDVILLNAYAYWGGVDISRAQLSIRKTINRVRKAAKGKEVWIGETGWPAAGPTVGNATATLENLQSAWTQLKCPHVGDGGPLFGMNAFWYGTFDQPFRRAIVEQNFGVATAERKLKISLACPKKDDDKE